MARKATVLNQNQSWNLSLEGAWNSTTVNGITENRTFNEVYEILTSNSNPLTHDRKGNLTQNKDGSQYTWDYNNQLSHAVNASSENASYTYDALGRRISKQVVGTLTVYINIGYQIATEYQSTDGINFTEKQSYVYATYIDDPLVLAKASGERFYYHSNGQFSISKTTDEYKNVVEAYAYNAYGDVQILQSYAGLDNPYYFTGRQLDQETGLFYFRARYYDAKLGQFISRDPIGYVDGLSLYGGYFAINGVDPNGFKSLRKRIKKALSKAASDVGHEAKRVASSVVNEVTRNAESLGHELVRTLPKVAEYVGNTFNLANVAGYAVMIADFAASWAKAIPNGENGASFHFEGHNIAIRHSLLTRKWFGIRNGGHTIGNFISYSGRAKGSNWVYLKNDNIGSVSIYYDRLDFNKRIGEISWVDSTGVCHEARNSDYTQYLIGFKVLLGEHEAMHSRQSLFWMYGSTRGRNFEDDSDYGSLYYEYDNKVVKAPTHRKFDGYIVSSCSKQETQSNQLPCNE